MPARKQILLAYIDPALGSMLLQAVAGTIFAAMIMGRRVLAAPLRLLHGIAGAVLVLMTYGRVFVSEAIRRDEK
jgi:hypothetical protein